MHITHQKFIYLNTVINTLHSIKALSVDRIHWLLFYTNKSKYCTAIHVKMLYLSKDNVVPECNVNNMTVLQVSDVTRRMKDRETDFSSYYTTSAILFRPQILNYLGISRSKRM